jgi:hypothetical protein
MADLWMIYGWFMDDFMVIISNFDDLLHEFSIYYHQIIHVATMIFLTTAWARDGDAGRMIGMGLVLGEDFGNDRKDLQ